MGSLTGIFVADKSRIEALIKSGDEIYFGEVLGKHSEICGPLAENEIALVSDDPEIIKIFKDHDMSCGFNPLEYYDRK